MTNISENFAKAISYKGLKQIDISKKYNIPRQTVNIFMTNQKTITEKLIDICKNENINLNFIATGQGNILNEDCEELNIDIYEKLQEVVEKLTPKKAEIYYHKILADVLEEEL